MQIYLRNPNRVKWNEISRMALISFGCALLKQVSIKVNGDLLINGDLLMKSLWERK